MKEGSENDHTASGEEDAKTKSQEILAVAKMTPPKEEKLTQKLTNLASNIHHTDQQTTISQDARPGMVTGLLNFNKAWMPQSSNAAKEWSILAIHQGNQWAQDILKKATEIGVDVLDKICTAVETKATYFLKKFLDEGDLFTEERSTEHIQVGEPHYLGSKKLQNCVILLS